MRPPYDRAPAGLVRLQEQTDSIHVAADFIARRTSVNTFIIISAIRPVEERQ